MFYVHGNWLPFLLWNEVLIKLVSDGLSDTSIPAQNIFKLVTKFNNYTCCMKNFPIMYNLTYNEITK
jgi:hypothetical protein